MLEKNKSMLKQITTLSTLMVNLSSCIKFDRYHGYDSAEQLDAMAHDLAKNRDLYASESMLDVMDLFCPIDSVNSVTCSQPAVVSSALKWMLFLDYLHSLTAESCIICVQPDNCNATIWKKIDV